MGELRPNREALEASGRWAFEKGESAEFTLKWFGSWGLEGWLMAKEEASHG